MPDGSRVRAELAEQLREAQRGYQAAQESVEAAAGDPDLAELAQEEVDSAQKKINALEDQIDEIDPRTPEEAAAQRAAAAEAARADARAKAARRGADLVEEYKEKGLGQQAGRSGGHGTPYKQAGADLIREANKLSADDPLQEALEIEGRQLIDYGKAIDHRGGGIGS